VDNDEAAEVLRDTDALSFIDVALGTRKAFSNAAASGLAVSELKPPDQKATDEIEMLYRYVFDIKKTSQPAS
jgi:chromosome partitioning protein